MKASIKKTKQAYDILEKYNGNHPYIKMLKYDCFVKKNKTLNDLDIEYVIENHDFLPEKINKIVKISKWFGEKCKEKWQVDFLPEKLLIIDILGETKSTLHVYVKYRRSQEKPVMLFIPKKFLLDDPRATDFNDLYVDFSKYNEILEKYGRKLYNHQESAVKFLLSRKKIILADSPGLGKMEYVENKVFTPKGRKKIGDLKLGDKIIGSNGKPYNIIGIYPQGEKELYRVTFNDGYSILVGGEHLWSVQPREAHKSKSSVYSKKTYITLSTNQLLNKNLTIERNGSGHNKEKKYKFKTYYKNDKNESKWSIPIVKPINFENNEDLPIEPYIMGLCIGYGHFLEKKVNFTIHKDDFDEMFTGVNIIENNNNKRKNVRVGYIKFENNEISNLELSNIRSWDKFIPDKYKYSSIENRLNILRGLMDTDGYCAISKNGNFNCTEFSTVSERLADDVVEIVHSLGGIVRKSSKIGSYTKNDVKHICRKSYKLNIKMPDGINPFKLKRKYDLYNSTKKYKVNRYIKNIQLECKGDAVCISVDSPDKLYVTEHAIVTHNTTSTIVSTLEGGFKKILIICPASLKSNWRRELNMLVSNDEIGIVNKNEWVYDKKYTIINYDILNRFYKIPTETIIEEVLTDKGVIKTEKIVKSRKKEIIDKAKSESTLLLENFDLVIIDEAHKLSNNTSNRYKIIEDFLNRSNIQDVYLMTGTPITNKPLNFLNVITLIGHELSDDWEFYVKTYCDGKQITPKKTGKPIWITSGASNLDELREKVKNCYIRRVKDDIPGMVERNVIERYYDLTNEEQVIYDKTWDEYQKSQFEVGNFNLNKDLTEGILLRMQISDFMIERTISLANEILDDNEKVFIGCAFNSEIDKLKEYYGDKCVIYNGSMTSKQKDYAENQFMTNPNVKVFIGNILASGVGLNLTAASKMIVNSIPYVPGDLIQLIDRLHRLTQDKDVYAYIQLFSNTISEKIWDTIIKKQLIIDKVIKKETDK